MRVLVACEYSGRVRDAFRKKGHNAMSCDIVPTDVPGPHYQGDVLDIINDGFDLIIAFPPCTHLAVSGAKHFHKKREDGRQREAIEFFMAMMNADCPRIAVENPVGIISGKYVTKHFPDLVEKHGLPIKSTQTVQPYYFGDEVQKTTCLWLKGLPELKPTNMVGKGDFWVSPDGKKRMSKWFSDNKCAKIRSTTFPGLAQAMADQWGNL